MIKQGTGGAAFTQLAIFKQIWQLSNKRSFLSGLFLRNFEGTDLFLNCFSHVLAKGQNKYPYFKIYAKNIVLLTPGEHALFDQGSESDRMKYKEEHPYADWDKLYKLKEELEAEYKATFPYTFMGMIAYKYDEEETIAKVSALNRAFFDKMIKG